MDITNVRAGALHLLTPPSTVLENSGFCTLHYPNSPHDEKSGSCSSGRTGACLASMDITNTVDGDYCRYVTRVYSNLTMILTGSNLILYFKSTMRLEFYTVMEWRVLTVFVCSAMLTYACFNLQPPYTVDVVQFPNAIVISFPGQTSGSVNWYFSLHLLKLSRPLILRLLGTLT
jgi:hypothetical protein